MGLCLEWVGGLEGVGWEVGRLYSPVNGAAGPLTHCPGAAGLQISTHAHICTEEQPDHLKGNFEPCVLRCIACMTCTFLRNIIPHDMNTDRNS